MLSDLSEVEPVLASVDLVLDGLRVAEDLIDLLLQGLDGEFVEVSKDRGSLLDSEEASSADLIVLVTRLDVQLFGQLPPLGVEVLLQLLSHLFSLLLHGLAGLLRHQKLSHSPVDVLNAFQMVAILDKVELVLRQEVGELPVDISGQERLLGSDPLANAFVASVQVGQVISSEKGGRDKEDAVVILLDQGVDQLSLLGQVHHLNVLIDDLDVGLAGQGEESSVDGSQDFFVLLGPSSGSNLVEGRDAGVDLQESVESRDSHLGRFGGVGDDRKTVL